MLSRFPSLFFFVNLQFFSPSSVFYPPSFNRQKRGNFFLKRQLSTKKASQKNTNITTIHLQYINVKGVYLIYSFFLTLTVCTNVLILQKLLCCQTLKKRKGKNVVDNFLLLLLIRNYYCFYSF